MSQANSSINLTAPVVPPLTAGAAQLWAAVGAEFNRLSGLLQRGATFIWNNPSGATPQQTVAAMGTNAAALFQLSSLVCTLIGQITGTTPGIMPAGWTYVANSDGSVTLTPPTA
jgi:hypothetical protein